MKSETEVLAEMVNRSRQLTLMYFDKLKNTDLHKIYELNGVKLNSAFWIMAHLAVTENGLLLRCTGGEHVKIPWTKQFGLGSEHSTEANSPSISEVLETQQMVHEKAIRQILSLPLEKLDEDNPTGFEFAGEKSIRFMIMHAIRHEALHSGHLGWLCKLNGIKTF